MLFWNISMYYMEKFTKNIQERKIRPMKKKLIITLLVNNIMKNQFLFLYILMETQ